ncbi:MAG: hypothetical protein RAO92_09395, partial [Candidatus Euphemobacter frigidus]|nr:hypothetical protein [Candidatus Euphemobacter frigidus]
RSFLGLVKLPPAALPVGLRPPSRAAGGDPGGKPCTSVFPAATIFALYKKYNKGYYFRLPYIWRRLGKSLRAGRLLSDIKGALTLVAS